MLSEIDNGAHLEFKDHIALNQLLKQIIRHEQFSANEKDLIIKALKKNHNKRKLAARDLQISERTLYRKLKEYHIDN